MFVLNGLLALSVLLLLVFTLALMSRVNLLSRQIDNIDKIIADSEEKLQELVQKFHTDNGGTKK